MKTLILSLFFTLPTWAQFQVKVTGIKNAKGQIRLLIFDQKSGFPSDHTKARTRLSLPAAMAKNGIITFTLKENTLPSCAFVAIHDENSNKKLDRNLIKIPKEGVAISNGISVPPRYHRALVAKPKSPLSMKLKYW